MSLKVFLILVFAKCVISDGGSLLEPCHMHDMECLGRATQQFLEQTCKGIPAYNIRPIDPLIITSLDYVAYEDMGLVFHFKNLNVTGLKNQKISDFRMDTSAKSVLLKTKADLRISGDVVIELLKQSKSFSGPIFAETSIIGAAQYEYELKNDDKGVQHFDVGPETFTCEPVGEVTVTFGTELAEALRKDPVAIAYRQDYESHSSSIRQRTICKIVEICYIDVVHNIRASAKILPTSAFIKDF